MKYTLQQLLDEISLLDFKKGQIFETQITFFPDEKTPKSKKNLNIKGIIFTKPLASSRKDKKNYFKEQSPIKSFYNNSSKGDILEVLEVEDDCAKCINLSIKDEIKESYYKDEFIYITKKMLAEGFVKHIQRNVLKAKKEASMKTKDLTEKKEKKIINYLKNNGYSQNNKNIKEKESKKLSKNKAYNTYLKIKEKDMDKNKGDKK